ncbi:MAG: ricin-type beta-trefoil lectin domain protein, partial [Bacteroidota bacterium]
GFYWESGNRLHFYLDGKWVHSINNPPIPFIHEMVIVMALETYDFNYPSGDNVKDGFTWPNGSAKSKERRSTRYQWVRTWKEGSGSGGGSSSTVTMRKGNNTGYAIDGGNGGRNGQNVYLWGSSSSNVNQNWEEINRGGGYYSYKKKNTNYCLDGGNGGRNGQNVYLWSCASNNQNQHWKKVNLGNGRYRLEKRNASNYSIDGGNGGRNGQNLYLWSSSNSNGNQQWLFGSGNARFTDEITLNAEDQNPTYQVYPNPVSDNLIVSGVEVGEYLEIYSLEGSLLMRHVARDASSEISLVDLESGLYLLRVMNATGQNGPTLKIVKN